MRSEPARIETITTAELDPARLDQLRVLLDRAFDDFDDHDWAHTLGGHHVLVVVEGGAVVAHASVVERAITVGDGTVGDRTVGDRTVRAGYVEAVATDPEHQGRGTGRAVMERAGDVIRRHFDLGVLCTGLDGFYERFGWERWRGPTSVRRADGAHPTPDDDGLIFVLRHGPSADVDLDAPISCDERPGDVW